MKLFRSYFTRNMTLLRNNDQLKNFTSVHLMEAEMKKQAKKKKDTEKEGPLPEEALSTGRSWLTNELRLKSTDQLHKLWYVFLREKNSILADNALLKRIRDKELPKDRLFKVERSMKRLKAVIAERQKVQDQYRTYLEDQYTQKKREELKDQYEEQYRSTNMAPEFSYPLLRAKYFALMNGKDNLDYLKEFDRKKEQKEKLKAYLKEKYDYKNKKIVQLDELKEEEQKEALENQEKYIIGFTNFVEEQLKQGKTKVSQEEILRAHIKNWRILDFKQRRIVLNMLNARRARDAKSAFVKEINLLAQKIAYENKSLSQ